VGVSIDDPREERAMEIRRTARIVAVTAGLLSLVIAVGSLPPNLRADQSATGARNDAPPRRAEIVPPSAPDDFVRLDVREDDLLLTNISERPINAWVVKQVVRSSQGYEAYTTLGVDAFRSPKFPGGEERLLQPGESVTLEKGEEPWIREDHRGPGSGVFYEVGAVTFDGGEAVGDPEIVDRIFGRRLDLAKTALKALEVTAAVEAGDTPDLDELPPQYRGRLEFFASREQAVRAIHDEAWADYEWTVRNLRPGDRVQLPSPEEVSR
jgi:hypothetical protein